MRGWALRVKTKPGAWVEVGYSLGGRIRVRTGGTMGAHGTGQGSLLDTASARRLRRALSVAIRDSVDNTVRP